MAGLAETLDFINTNASARHSIVESIANETNAWTVTSKLTASMDAANADVDTQGADTEAIVS